MLIFFYKWLFLLIFLPFLFRYSLGKKSPKHKALKVPFFDEVSSLTASGKGQIISRVTFLKILTWLIWICLVISAMRPQVIGEKIPITEEARTMILILDASGSMQEEDFNIKGVPTARFDVMKQIVGDFIKEREGDKIGIVLFGTHAYVYAPPTDDTKTLLYLLDTAQLGLVGENTAIGDGIGMAVKMISELPQEQRVAILLSDGNSNAGTLHDEEALELAKQANIKIYTIAMGAPPSNNSFFGFNFMKSLPIDDTMLKKIAKETDGKFYSAKNTKELSNIYDEINNQEPISDKEKFFRPTKEVFYLPLSISFMLSLILFALVSWRHKQSG